MERLLYLLVILCWCVSSCQVPVDDVMTAPNLCHTHIEGAVGKKMDNFLENRIFSEFARDSVFGEARDAFKNQIDDKFKAPAGYWQGEFWGKLMMGASRVAMYSGDKDLMEFIKAESYRLLEYQEEDGYLGTYSDKTFMTSPDPEVARKKLGWECDYNWNLWCRKYTMWGLLLCYKATGEKSFLDAVVKSMDQEIEMLDSLEINIWDTGTSKFLGFPSCSVLKPLMQLYQITADEKYLTFATKIVKNWDCEHQHAPSLISNAFTDRPIHKWYAKPQVWAKGYELLSCLDGLLEYYRVTGEKRILDAVIRLQDKIWEYEKNQMYSVGYNDKFSGAYQYPNGISEPCDAIHWIRLNYDLFMITGNPKYVDVMELTFFNGFLAGVFREGTWGARGVRTEGYHNVPNGQSGMRLNHCCVNNMPRTFMDVAQTLVTSDKKRRVYINWYSDFTASINGVDVKVSGNYPVFDSVSVSVACNRPQILRFRIPSWCPKMMIDGKPACGEWHEVKVASDHTFSVVFEMPVNIGGLEREEIPEYGVADYRQTRWVCGDNDLLPYLRKEPHRVISRGPLVLAKSAFVGNTLDEILSVSDLHKHLCVTSMTPIENSNVWGAWNLKLSDGTSIDVCDYSSACDTRHTDKGYQFSIFF